MISCSRQNDHKIYALHFSSIFSSLYADAYIHIYLQRERARETCIFNSFQMSFVLVYEAIMTVPNCKAVMMFPTFMTQGSVHLNYKYTVPLVYRVLLS